MIDKITASQRSAALSHLLSKDETKLSVYYTEAPAIALRKWALDRAISTLSLPSDAATVIDAADKFVAWIEGAAA